jgi:hypothetical protein
MPVSSATSLTAISGRRVADVGPASRVQPDQPQSAALHEQDLTRRVADDGADRDLRRDVAGTPSPTLPPLLHEMVGLAFDGRRRLVDLVECARRRP